jgi:hypothetical protein
MSRILRTLEVHNLFFITMLILAFRILWNFGRSWRGVATFNAF